MTDDEFLAQYGALLEHRIIHTGGYAYGVGEVPRVARNMLAALKRGSYVLERNSALTDFCKKVGVKATKKGLDTWVKEHLQ